MVRLEWYNYMQARSSTNLPLALLFQFPKLQALLWSSKNNALGYKSVKGSSIYQDFIEAQYYLFTPPKYFIEHSQYLRHLSLFGIVSTIMLIQ